MLCLAIRAKRANSIASLPREVSPARSAGDGGSSGGWVATPFIGPTLNYKGQPRRGAPTEDVSVGAGPCACPEFGRNRANSYCAHPSVATPSVTRFARDTSLKREAIGLARFARSEQARACIISAPTIELSIMDLDGLTRKFKVNRPLGDWEINHQLHPGRPTAYEPWGKIAVIKMNSTYLECVDKFYKDKGVATAVSLSGAGIMVLGALGFFVIEIGRWADSTPDDHIEAVLFLLAISAIFSAGVAVAATVFLKEIFCFTHYPIRFNRKNRLVYVTRLDGTVMVEPWDRLFFALGDCGFDGTRDIRGHRLAEDGKTILETFAFPHYGPKDYHYLLSFWEFVRRYMEEGPEKLMTRVERTVNISERKESFERGFEFHFVDAANSLGTAVAMLLTPVALWFATGRRIAILTSKIPRWPDEVEAECQIEEDDPYIVDEYNPPAKTDRKE